MSNRYTSQRQPTQRSNWLLVSTGVLCLVWLVLVPLRYVLPIAAPDNIAPIAPFFIAIAGGLAAWVGSVFAQSIAAGARVMGQRQVPTRLWRWWLMRGLKEALVYFCLLALAVVTLSLHDPVPWHALTGAAVVSVVMAVAVVRGLAIQGLVPRILAWIAPVLVVLLAVVSTWSGGFTAALRWIDSWPWMVLLCATTTWPVLIWVICARWLHDTPVARYEAVGSIRSLWQRAQELALRFTPLTGWTLGHESARNTARRSVFQVMFFPAYMMLTYGNVLAHPVFGQSALVRIGMLGTLMIVASTGLVCKDLHWRMLLAPGGMRRGRLGWHITVSTVTVHFFSLLIFGAVVAGVGLLFSGSVALLLTHGGPMAFFSRLTAFPFELVFAVAMATLVRGTKHHKRWIAGLIAVWVLVGLVFVFTALPRGPSSWEFLSAIAAVPLMRDSEYRLTLVVLSVMAVLCANRLWTLDKLLQCAPK